MTKISAKEIKPGDVIDGWTVKARTWLNGEPQNAESTALRLHSGEGVVLLTLYREAWETEPDKWAPYQTRCDWFRDGEEVEVQR